MQITPEIHMVDGVRGAHVYIILDNGVTLVDAGMGGSHKPILKAIKDLGYGPYDIKRIIITHAHIDHILQALKPYATYQRQRSWRARRMQTRSRARSPCLTENAPAQ